MIWKHIKGFEEYYLISDIGQVWSIRSEKVLKAKIDRYGYEVVVLSVDGIPHYKYVHRLVAQAFIPNPNHIPTVNHINEVKTDNRAENLEWLSVKDNVNYGTRNEKMSDTKSKLPVEQILLDGSTVRYKGAKDASRKTGINPCCIAKCCKNIRKTAGGYKWRYANENS
jgi:hypothetical protein